MMLGSITIASVIYGRISMLVMLSLVIFSGYECSDKSISKVFLTDNNLLGVTIANVPEVKSVSLIFCCAYCILSDSVTVSYNSNSGICKCSAQTTSNVNLVPDLDSQVWHTENQETNTTYIATETTVTDFTSTVQLITSVNTGVTINSTLDTTSTDVLTTTSTGESTTVSTTSTQETTTSIGESTTASTTSTQETTSTGESTTASTSSTQGTTTSTGEATTASTTSTQGTTTSTGEATTASTTSGEETTPTITTTIAISSGFGIVNVSCPNNEIITNLITEYAENVNDRNWNLQCTPFSDTLHSCYWTGFMNEIHTASSPLYYDCNNNGIIIGIYSIFNSTATDRRYKLLCCEMTVKSLDTSTYAWANMGYTQDMTIPIPSGHVIYQIMSVYNGSYKDRQLKFRHCMAV